MMPSEKLHSIAEYLIFDCGHNEHNQSDSILEIANEIKQSEDMIAEVTKLAKEPIVNIANSEHDDALLRLVRIIEVLEEGG